MSALQKQLEATPAPLNITPVILVGGHGKRLRPITSPKRAKPFLKAGGKYSFFQETLRRAASMDAPIIIGRARDEAQITSECAAMGIAPRAIILEPCARNTAPAIAVAAVLTEAENTRLCIMPSDHAIPSSGVAPFTRALGQTREDVITVLGITPRGPVTRYGYILHAQDKPVRFTEKPDKNAARDFIAQGALWHSGMFVARAKTLVQAFKRHCPAALGAAHYSLQKARSQGNIIRLDETQFAKAPSISIDYAVLEKQKELYLQTLDIGWSDIGCLRDYIAHCLRIFKG